MDLKTFLSATRLEKPLPIIILISPCIGALILLSENGYPQLMLTIIAIVGGICARTAGCMINDLIDVEIDKKVERSKNRALTSKRIKESDFYLVLIFFSFVSCVMLSTLGIKSILTGIITAIATIIYPLTKRFFFFPQLILGLVFNSGIIIISIATNTETIGRAFALYIGAVCWTIGYDTIYSMQDIEDDRKIKMNSSALNFQDPKKLISRSYDICTLMWLSTGTISNLNYIYYICIFFVWLLLKRQIHLLDVSKKESCQKMFDSNIFVAAALLISLFLGKKLMHH